jgi:D-inositol-3-phosphate glycosyltransferase
MQFVLIGPSAPLRGGIALDNDALAHALRQAGHLVQQVSFSRLYPALLFPGRTQYDLRSTGEQAKEHAPRPMAQAHPWLDSVNPLSWWHTGRRIAQFQSQLVTVQWWHPFFAPCYASLLAYLKRACPGVPRLLISHNTRPHEPVPGQDAALRLVARLCDGVIVHSRSEYALTAKVAPGTVIRLVEYPLLETPRTLPERAAAQRRLGISGRALLFFGYVRKYKGLSLLLRALAQVPRELGVSLLVAGEFYEPIERYREQIRTLDLDKRVHLLDRYVGEPEWPDLFAATDALVLPYLTASQSMSITLAYGFGKPVIVTRVGGLAEAVEEGRTGLIAEPEPTAFAEVIRRFYTEFLLSPYQASISARQQHLGWESFIRLLEGWPHPVVQKSVAAV